MDDIILTRDDKREVQRIKTELAAKFEMKDLGNLWHFLEMEVARNPTGVSISQQKYTLDLLKEIGMIGAKPVETPMDPNVKLETKPEDAPIEKSMTSGEIDLSIIHKIEYCICG